MFAGMVGFFLVPIALQAGLPASAADEPRLRLDHLRRRRDRLDRLRAADRQGRPQTLVYATAFLLAILPLLLLSWLGATTAMEVLILATATYAILQTIAFSLYLYSAELYPTRLRAVGTGFGIAWLRAGSSVGARSPRSRWSVGS